MFAEIDFWDDRDARSPASQMAVDEALLLVSSCPVLRTYGWDRPAISFGYSQRIEAVREKNPDGLPMIRRWTGGGIVRHGDDLTLALVIPAGFGFDAVPSAEIYAAVHTAVGRALAAILPDVRQAGDGDRREGPECFISPVAGDLLAGRVKLCGGALRRTRDGLIYQGSIQSAPLPERESVVREFARKVGNYDPAAATTAAEELVRRKYADPAWNELR